MLCPVVSFELSHTHQRWNQCLIHRFGDQIDNQRRNEGSNKKGLQRIRTTVMAGNYEFLKGCNKFYRDC